MTDPKEQPFDPYHKWLGIPKQFRPPTYYHLLGLNNGETDLKVIEEAVIRQSANLRPYQMGDHADVCAKLLNQIGRAKQILLNPEKRAEYDRRLQSIVSSAAPVAMPPVAALPQPMGAVYLVPIAPPPTPGGNLFAVHSDNDDVPTSIESGIEMGSSRSTRLNAKKSSTGPVVAGLAVGGLVLVGVIVAVFVSMSSSTPGPKSQGPAVAASKKKAEDTRPPVEPPRVKVIEKPPVPPPVETPIAKLPPPKTIPKVVAPPAKTPLGPFEQAMLTEETMKVVKEYRTTDSFDILEPLRDGRVIYGDGRGLKVHDLSASKSADVKQPSTDGKILIAAAEDDSVILLIPEKKVFVRQRLKPAETLQRFSPMPPMPVALAMAANGTRFWVGSQDGTLTAFDTNSPKPAASLLIPGEESMLIATPADGAFVACVRAKQLAFGWSAAKIVEVNLPSTSLVRSLAISPNGQIVMLGTREGLYAATLPADLSAKTPTLTWNLLVARGSFTELAMAPNGRFAFCATDTQVYAWDLPSLKPAGGHTAPSLVNALAVSRDSQLLMIGDVGGNLTVLGVPGNRTPVVAKIDPTKPQPKSEQPLMPPVARMDVPPAEKLAEATKLIHEQFAKDFANAKKSAVDRATLAERFVRLARETNDDLVARYVLLTEARDLACQAAKWSQATEAISVLVLEYDLDENEQRLNALRSFFKVAVPKDAAEEACEAILDFTNDALDNDRFKAAKQYVALGSAGAIKAQNASLQGQFAKLDKDVKSTELEYDRMIKAKAMLAEGNDEAAQLDVGRYLVIRKGDWTAGLEFLAKTGTDSFGEIARKDLANPKDAKEQQEVGNLWWKVAEKEKGAARLAFLGRAGHWYRLAVPTMTGLNLAVMTDRLKTIDDAGQVPAVAIDPAKAELRRYRGHAGAVLSLFVAGDNRRFYSGGADGTIRSWDIATGRQLSSFNVGTQAANFAFSPDQRFLAVHDGLRVRVLTTDAIPRFLHVTDCISPPIWLDNNQLFGVALSGATFNYTPGAAVIRKKFGGLGAGGSTTNAPLPQTATRLDPIPAPSQTFTVAKQCYLIETANAHRVVRMQLPEATLATAIPSLGEIVLGGTDKTLRKYATASEKQTASYVGLNELPRCVVVSESGKRVAAGGLDKVATVWDADTEKVVVRFTQHTGAIQALAFLQGERQMLSASADGTIRLWNVPSDLKSSK